MNEQAVLDASAILALMNDEPGKEAVEAALPGAWVSAVNVAEVVSKLADRGFAAAEMYEDVLALEVRVAEFNSEQAQLAGELRPLTRAQGLSLGDRCCLALALQKRAVALTTDRRWQDLPSSLGIAIRNIRPVS